MLTFSRQLKKLSWRVTFRYSNSIQGVRLCETTTKLAYANANVSEKFELMIEPHTAHAVTKAAHTAAVDWFKKWLAVP